MIRLSQTVRKNGQWFVQGYSEESNGQRVGFTFKADTPEGVMNRMRRLQQVIDEVHPRGKLMSTKQEKICDEHGTLTRDGKCWGCYTEEKIGPFEAAILQSEEAGDDDGE